MGHFSFRNPLGCAPLLIFLVILGMALSATRDSEYWTGHVLVHEWSDLLPRAFWIATTIYLLCCSGHIVTAWLCLLVSYGINQLNMWFIIQRNVQR